MKTKTLYECEFCHTQFNDADNMTPTLRDMGAPNYIDVLLDNGKTVRYSATREIESR